MDWTIVGGVAAVAAVIIAILQLRASGLDHAGSREAASRTVRVRTVDLKGEIPPTVKTDSSYSRLTAERFRFENESGRDLREVRLRVAPTSRVWSALITKTSSLSEEAIKINVEEESVSISIAELPKAESFDVTIFSNDFYISFQRVKSENASVTLVEG